MKTKSGDQTIARYCQRLEDALAALPPDETAELVTEVESHLRQAAEEGRLSDYLEELGAAESFGASILAERGLLPEPDQVPEAPRWRRVMAGLIDLTVAVAPFTVTLVVGLFAFAPADQSRVLGALMALGPMVVALGWGAWYWRRRTRKGGRSSAGMILAGLRAVRAGSQVRIVRQSSVSGERPKVRAVLGGLVLLGVASLVLFPILFETVSWRGRQADQAERLAVMHTASDLSSVLNVVGLFGATLADGAADDRLSPLVDPEALSQAAPLIERARRGDIDGLLVVQAEEPRYDSMEDLGVSAGTFGIHALVQGGPGIAMRLVVQKRVWSQGEDSFQMDYRIVRIELPGL